MRRGSAFASRISLCLPCVNAQFMILLKKDLACSLKPVYSKAPSTVQMDMKLDVDFTVSSKKQCLEMNERKTGDLGQEEIP